MKRVRNFMFASAGLLIIVVTVTVATGGRTIAQITAECIKICDEVPVRVALTNIARIAGDVRITNESDSPIPTKLNGAVLVDSSKENAVRTRSALQVSDVFQKEVTITLEPNQVADKVSFLVPQSRLLVIESFSGFATTGHPLQTPFVNFQTIANGEAGTHAVLSKQEVGGWSLFAPGGAYSQAYADPSSKVEVRFFRAGGIGTATMTLTFTGHYIDQ